MLNLIYNFDFGFEWATDFMTEVGIIKGLLVIFIIILFFYNSRKADKLYKINIEGKQEEINRIAAENREYRERFLKLLDNNNLTK